MKNLADVLRNKETQLKNLEAQVEHLRTTMRILSDEEAGGAPDRPVPYPGSDSPSPVSAGPTVVVKKAWP